MRAESRFGAPLRMHGKNSRPSLTALVRSRDGWRHHRQGRTPARAGQTSPTRRPSSASGVDPCTCRANPQGWAKKTLEAGGPLRVQGKHQGGDGPVRSRVDPCACRATPGSAKETRSPTGGPLRVQGKHEDPCACRVRGPEFSPPEADRNRHLRPVNSPPLGRRNRAVRRGRAAADE